MHVQFSCSLDNLNTLSSGDVVGNFSLISSVVHKEELNIIHVSDEESLESTLSEVSGLFVVSLTDVWHS